MAKVPQIPISKDRHGLGFSKMINLHGYFWDYDMLMRNGRTFPGKNWIGLLTAQLPRSIFCNEFVY